MILSGGSWVACLVIELLWALAASLEEAETICLAGGMASPVMVAAAMSMAGHSALDTLGMVVRGDCLMIWPLKDRGKGCVAGFAVPWKPSTEPSTISSSNGAGRGQQQDSL
jgi:hypothetical protein